MFHHTLLIVFLKIPVRAEITIDLSKAELDKESGNFCVIQKVGVGGWMTLRDHWLLISGSTVPVAARLTIYISSTIQKKQVQITVTKRCYAKEA